MAWTEITRPKYQREGLRYASDTTEEKWAVIAPPPAAGAPARAAARDLAAQRARCDLLHRPKLLPVAYAAVSSQIKCERELAIREWCKFVMIRMHLRANRPETIACRLLFDLFQEIQFVGERAGLSLSTMPA